MKKSAIFVLLALCMLLTACGRVNISYEPPKWFTAIKQLLGADTPDATQPIALSTEPATELPTEPATEPATEPPTEPVTEPPVSHSTFPYYPYTDVRGVVYEKVEPYPIPIANPAKKIYDSPDGTYTRDFGRIGYYTIIEQAEDPDGYTWGKLSTGEGWTLVYQEILPNLDMTFASGAGSWSNMISIGGTGFFSGYYHDSDIGFSNNGPAYSILYECEYDGKFNVTDISRYAITLKLADIDYNVTPGQTWFDNNVKHISTDPYGLENCTYFTLYIPETPISSLPESLISWMHGTTGSTLGCYALYNPTTGDAFFSYK